MLPFFNFIVLGGLIKLEKQRSVEKGQLIPPMIDPSTLHRATNPEQRNVKGLLDHVKGLLDKGLLDQAALTIQNGWRDCPRLRQAALTIQNGWRNCPKGLSYQVKKRCEEYDAWYDAESSDVEKEQAEGPSMNSGSLTYLTSEELEKLEIDDTDSFASEFSFDITVGEKKHHVVAGELNQCAIPLTRALALQMTSN